MGGRRAACGGRGDGSQRREIILVNDFVRILCDLSQNFDNDIFNIGAGEEFSIRQFAEMISHIVGFDPDTIQYDVSRYVGATSKCLSIEKARSAVPYHLTSLQDGLTQTIHWFYEQKAF